MFRLTAPDVLYINIRRKTITEHLAVDIDFL